MPPTPNKVESTWGNAVRDRTVQNFATAAARDSAIPSPVVGQMCCIDNLATVSLGLLQYCGATDGWQKPWNMPWGVLPGGSALATSNQGSITTVADLTNLTITVTVVANRLIRLYADGLTIASTAGTVTTASITLVESATQLGATIHGGFSLPTTSFTEAPISTTFTPAVGAHTYKLRGAVLSGGGTMTTVASATAPWNLVAEDIGPAGAPA